MADKHVLIIDDEDGIRKIVQVSLELIAGWEVLTAASGPEGLAIAARSHPDAILLDATMPNMDGFTTLQQLKANPLTQTIPTILLTARSQPSEQQKFYDLGIAGIIAKPFKAPDMILQMRSILNWF